jgi:pyruvate/2-oxoacid:ferredoxin oxidoreductase beta subunit
MGLARRAHHTVPAETLLTEVWGPEYAGEVEHVKHYIWTLRSKIEVDPGDPKHMAQTFAKAIQHKGFALVDVLQICVVYNHVNTTEWYRPRVYKLDDDPNYNPRDYNAAMQKAQEWGDKIPIGVLYVDERATYEDQVAALTNGALVKQSLTGYSKETWDEFRAA